MRGTKQALAGPMFICVFTGFFTDGLRSKQQILVKQQACAFDRQDKNYQFVNATQSLMKSLYRRGKATIAVMNFTIFIEKSITK